MFDANCAVRATVALTTIARIGHFSSPGVPCCGEDGLMRGPCCAFRTWQGKPASYAAGFSQGDGHRVADVTGRSGIGIGRRIMARLCDRLGATR